MDSVLHYLKKENWELRVARKTVYSERKAAQAKKYNHESFRRVDLIIQISKLTPTQELIRNLEAFMANDTMKTYTVDLNIYFFNAVTDMKRKSIEQATALREFFAKHPRIIAELHGHVCCGHDYELSYERSETVAKFIAFHPDVNLDRFELFGHSNFEPRVWPERTDADRQKNRRVTAVFKKAPL
jgi:outer membrane protein OmpA-like peptidoglycan-associated protein